jgi:hypothetical protein
MAYRLDLENDLATATRLAARERLEKGAAVIAAEREEDPVGAVHQAHKEVKKSRSLLRLVRSGVGNRTYRREPHAAQGRADGRARARRGRDGRDGRRAPRALRRTAARTLVHKGPQPAGEGRVALAQAGGRRPCEELAETLRLVAGRVDEWPLDHSGWPVVRKGISRAYSRGRDAFARADKHPTTDNLHELRKRVKDLWYQERLLKPSWPAVLGAQADEAHQLSDLLGDDHDLAALAERLREDPPTEDAAELLELIDRRRQELLAQVRALGRRVYAEKPKAFARRLDRYLRSAEVADPLPA